MATIRQLKGSKRWNVQIRITGEKTISGTFNTKQQAEHWALEQEVSLSKNGPPETLLELGMIYCDRVLKGRSSHHEILGRIHFVAAKLPKLLKDITRKDMNEFRLKRLKEVSPTTVRDHMQLVNRIYRFAYREMILEPDEFPNPCKNVPFPPASKPRNHIITRDELSQLLAVLSPTMAGVVEIAFETAMRRSEIVNLTPRVLHLEDRFLWVIDGKTGDRAVPLTRRAVELLTESSRACPTSESRLYPVTPHAVSTAFRRARQAIGLGDDVRFHQLRHTRITEVAKKGFNQAQIMMVSGHRDVRSVQRYTHLSVHDVIGLLD